MSDATLTEMEYASQNGNVQGSLKYIMDRKRRRCFFMGCSRGANTMNAANDIVREITEREGIKDPLTFAFFDLWTDRGHDITPGTCQLKMLKFSTERQGLYVIGWMPATFPPELLLLFGLRPK